MNFAIEYIKTSGSWIWNGTKYPNEHVLAKAFRTHIELETQAEIRSDMVSDEELAVRWTYYVIPRLEIIERTRCFFCGCRTEKKTKSRDHLWPRSKGGTATVLACKNCNTAKGNMTLEQFRYIRYGGNAEFHAETVMRLLDDSGQHGRVSEIK